jgi:hypothetical protein
MTENIKKTLYGEKNGTLLKTLVSKRIMKTIGVDINENEDFLSILGQVIQGVVEKETEKVKHLGVSDAVLKINNIIISEAVIFLISQVDKSTTLPQQPPQQPQQPPQQPQQQPQQPPRPRQKEIIYNLESKNFEYSKGNFTYKTNLDGISHIQLLSVFVDNTDYNVSETKNTLMVDQQEIKIKPGNYSQGSLLTALQSLLPDDVSLDFIKPTGQFVFSSNTPCKIDFTVKNSLFNVMGFQRNIYKVEDKLTGDSCILKNTPYIDAGIMFKYQEETKENIDLRIPLDVGRGDTKFFYPYISQSVNDVAAIEQIVVSFRDSEGNEFQTRNREFYISFKIQINFLM